MNETGDDVLLQLHSQVEQHLLEICKLFTQRPRITIVIRTPWLEAEGKEGDIILTDDNFELAIAAINRLRNRKPIVEATSAKH